MLKSAALVIVGSCVGSYAMGATCESLSSLSIPHTTIVAESVAAGAFAPAAPAGAKGKAPTKAGGGDAFANLPAFCRVQVTSKPSADSDIKIEYWLPVNGWNGNFEANGNGGWSGSITANTLAAGMQRGYAAAMTDTGHEGGSASFAMGHPEKVIDFGYRAVHEMAVTGKAVIKAFYGRDAKHSYWNGCSAGGRQGLMSAQRYPEDFDAIVAGAPAINFTGRSAQAVWIGQATHKDEASALPQAKFAAIHDAVLAACDAKDGVKDGVLEDPTKCKFDPKTLECSGADAPTCLTSAQVATVRAIYSDVVNPRTKSVIFQGHEPGSENGWTTMAGANVFTIATDTFKYAVFENNSWDYKTLNFDADMATTMQKTGNVVNALDPNLKPFISRGGKIIQYHGWSDPQISPRSSVEYYKSVAAAMGGASKINDNYRLFMVPGMAHCGGGDATANFDMLSALEQWVEQGKAPDRIEASRVRNGQTDRTRPLCPYPQVATYKGSGSSDDTANFVCK